MSKVHTDRLTRAALGVALLATAGCTSISVESHAYLGSPSLPPTDPSSVQILQTEPKRPYVRLGEIVVSPYGKPTLADLEQKVRAAAAKLGADAVIVEYDGSRMTGWSYVGPGWAPQAYVYYGRVIVTLAIHYTDG